MVLKKEADWQPPPYLEKPREMSANNCEDNKSTISLSSFATSHCSTCPASQKVVKTDGFSKKYIILLIVFIIFLFTGMYVLLAVTQAGECCRKMEQKLETMQRSIVFPQMLTLNHPDGAFDLKTDNLNEAIENAHATNKQQTATTPASKKPKSSRITIINQLVKSSSKSEESVNRCQSLLNQYRRLKRRPAPRRFHRYPMVSQLRLACDDACSANCENIISSSLLPNLPRHFGPLEEPNFPPMPPHLTFPFPPAFHPGFVGPPMLPPFPTPHEMMGPPPFPMPISLGPEDSQPMLNDLIRMAFFGCPMQREGCSNKQLLNRRNY